MTFMKKDFMVTVTFIIKKHLIHIKVVLVHCKSRYFFQALHYPKSFNYHTDSHENQHSPWGRSQAA